jgi:hypothetical protein
VKPLSPMERQRQDAAQRIIRYGDGFGEGKPCHECGSKVTAKVDGIWCCPFHVVVTQLELAVA